MKCKNCVRHVHLNDYGERTIGTPNWCFYLSDSPDEELERDCIAFKCSTNADRIRAMTDEELAELMEDKGDCPPIECPHDGKGAKITRLDCKACWLDWLRKEAKE